MKPHPDIAAGKVPALEVFYSEGGFRITMCPSLVDRGASLLASVAMMLMDNRTHAAAALLESAAALHDVGDDHDGPERD